MKKKIMFVISLCLLIAVIIVVKNGKFKMSARHGKISYTANEIKQLANDSDFIVVGKVEENRDTITYSNVEIIVSGLKVNESIKGNIQPNSKINILQTNNLDIDPIIKANEKVLLFLEKYEGPVTDNAYVIKGLYQGHYMIKNDIVKAASRDDYELKSKIDGKKLDDVKKEIVNN